jgi:hypothetical protein
MAPLIRYLRLETASNIRVRGYAVSREPVTNQSFDITTVLLSTARRQRVSISHNAYFLRSTRSSKSTDGQRSLRPHGRNAGDLSPGLERGFPVAAMSLASNWRPDQSLLF